MFAYWHTLAGPSERCPLHLFFLLSPCGGPCSEVRYLLRSRLTLLLLINLTSLSLLRLEQANFQHESTPCSSGPWEGSRKFGNAQDISTDTLSSIVREGECPRKTQWERQGTRCLQRTVWVCMGCGIFCLWPAELMQKRRESGALREVSCC